MIANGFINELQYESISSRKILERVPTDKMDWKPHVKSMSFGQLAAHMAEIPGYISLVLTQDELDLANRNNAPAVAKNTEELLQIFDTKIAAALADLQECDDASMMQEWTLRHGEHVIFKLPRVAALRSFAFSHFIHHRGQLAVYLRLLDIPVPSIYGPSADEAAA